MVRICLLCKKRVDLNPEVCFRSFPVNQEKRLLWLSIFDMEDGPHIPRRPDICSDHFSPYEVVTRDDGRRHINLDAIPLPNPSIFVDPSSSSSECSNIVTHEGFQSIICDRGQDTLMANGRESNQNDIFLPSPTVPIIRVAGASRESPNNMKKNWEKIHSSSSLSTETASESRLWTSCWEKQGTSSSTTSVTFSAENMSLKQKLPIRRKRKYIGDMESSDFSTPEKRRRNLKSVKNRDIIQRKKIHNLQMTVRRLKRKITSLKQLLCYLKEKSMISETSESTIKASLSGSALDIFERMLKGPTRQKYNPHLRSFALTLAFYSPKAYSFVRNTFNRSLPHLETISKWFRAVNGSPGFTQEALKALELKQKECPRQLLCNLVIDEMSIRQQVEWTGQKFTGYVDIGTNIDDDTLPEAREALLFMLVCINGSWKVPVGYFLLDGLSASEKAGLVKKCLQFVHASGIIITSLTFDGAAANLSMCEKLGADFTDPLNLKTWFAHPITSDPIYIILDACHMIKLIRNCLATQSGMKDIDNNDIKWEYITNLVEKQNLEGLHEATKIRMRHLQWDREKMKVRLATQTISRSVSDALTFLREDMNCIECLNSEGTSKFLLNFNNLFDILNSRNRFSKYIYKRPISEKTATPFFNFLEEMKIYIIGLTLKERPILKSARKTGFLGFLICIESIKKMYHNFNVWIWY